MVPLDVKANLQTGGTTYYSHPLGFRGWMKQSAANDDLWDGQKIKANMEFTPSELHESWNS